ncbi:MAG: putative coiled-coil protein SlyX, partial [Halioglobus sp.]
ELNDVILRQYKDIERLQLQQQEVMNRMAGSSSDADSAPSAIDEVPPHY